MSSSSIQQEGSTESTDQRTQGRGSCSVVELLGLLIAVVSFLCAFLWGMAMWIRALLISFFLIMSAILWVSGSVQRYWSAVQRSMDSGTLEKLVGPAVSVGLGIDAYFSVTDESLRRLLTAIIILMTFVLLVIPLLENHVDPDAESDEQGADEAGPKARQADMAAQVTGRMYGPTDSDEPRTMLTGQIKGRLVEVVRAERADSPAAARWRVTGSVIYTAGMIFVVWIIVSLVGTTQKWPDLEPIPSDVAMSEEKAFGNDVNIDAYAFAVKNNGGDSLHAFDVTILSESTGETVYQTRLAPVGNRTATVVEVPYCQMMLDVELGTSEPIKILVDQDNTIQERRENNNRLSTEIVEPKAPSIYIRPLDGAENGGEASLVAGSGYAMSDTTVYTSTKFLEIDIVGMPGSKVSRYLVVTLDGNPLDYVKPADEDREEDGDDDVYARIALPSDLEIRDYLLQMTFKRGAISPSYEHTVTVLPTE